MRALKSLKIEIKRTALEIAKLESTPMDPKDWSLELNELHTELDTYLKIYKSVALIQARKELDNG